MKQQVIIDVIKFLGKSILLTTGISVLIVIIGTISKWHSSIAYSNAFFLAGCLVIVAGTASRLGAGQGVNSLQYLNMESFRGMSGTERVNFIINANSPIGLVVLGLVTGISLILIAVIVSKL